MFKQLFDYESADMLDDSLIFYTCVLKLPIGNHKAGTKIQCISVDLINGITTFESVSAGVVTDRFDTFAIIGESRYAKEV